jgi:hypothetical protein
MVCWVVKSCSSKTAWCFKGTYKLRKKATEGGSKLSSAGFFLGLLFDPDDGGNMFLQHVDTTYTVLFKKIISINYQMVLWNTGLSMNYMALQLKKTIHFNNECVLVQNTSEHHKCTSSPTSSQSTRASFMLTNNTSKLSIIQILVLYIVRPTTNIQASSQNICKAITVTGR